MSKELGDEVLAAWERSLLIDPLVDVLRAVKEDTKTTHKLIEAIPRPEPAGFDWTAFSIGAGTGLVLGITAVIIGAFALDAK